MNMPKLQTGKSVWYGPDLVNRKDEWLVTVTPKELEELAVASNKLVESSSASNSINLHLLDNFEQEFQIPTLKKKVDEIRDTLQNGIGFLVWRGFPVEEWGYKRLAAAFLLIGKCMGNIRAQNAQGHVLGHVRDQGLKTALDTTVRGSQTSERLQFHVDFCDLFGLLCMQTAKSGGESLLVSAGAIYNEMLTNTPELLSELLKPIEFDRHGLTSFRPDGLPYYKLPIYTDYKGQLSITYVRAFIEAARRFPGVPPLTPNQIAAMDAFDKLANSDKLKFVRDFEPGDMTFVHNHTLLHARTDYVDWPEENKKRHLLRMWLAPLDSRELPEEWADHFGGHEVGQRGGTHFPGIELNAQL